MAELLLPAGNIEKMEYAIQYGADAVLDWHTTKPMNHDYTEEYEAFYHHEMFFSL